MMGRWVPTEVDNSRGWGCGFLLSHPCPGHAYARAKEHHHHILRVSPRRVIKSTQRAEIIELAPNVGGRGNYGQAGISQIRRFFAALSSRLAPCSPRLIFRLLSWLPWFACRPEQTLCCIHS